MYPKRNSDKPAQSKRLNYVIDENVGLSEPLTRIIREVYLLSTKLRKFIQKIRYIIPAKLNEHYPLINNQTIQTMDLTEAYLKHIEWKDRFRQAITNHEVLDASSISSDRCCELGKWLYGEAKKKFGGKFTYDDCVAKHADFHVEAGKIANYVNEKQFNEAENLLNAPGYNSASQSVGYAIFKLKEEISS